MSRISRGGNTRVGQVLIKVTNELDSRGMEIRIDSMQKNGTQSWMLINMGLNKFAKELLKRTRNLFTEEAPSSVVQLSTVFIFVNNLTDQSTDLERHTRHWEDLMVHHKILTLITRLLRHQGYPPEDDGAIERKNVVTYFLPDILEAEKQVWLEKFLRKRARYDLSIAGIRTKTLFISVPLKASLEASKFWREQS